MAGAVDQAIGRIMAGAIGDECEAPGLDFKQETNYQCARIRAN